MQRLACDCAEPIRRWQPASDHATATEIICVLPALVAVLSGKKGIES